MSGCGLKNSGCRNNSDSFPEAPIENDDKTNRRFLFVDGRSGLWSTTVVYPEMIVCPVGSMVVFHYPTLQHDIVALPSLHDYESCNMDEAIQLSPFSLPDSVYPDVSFYYNCTEPNSTAYLTCSVPGHCAAGQRIQIRTSVTEFAFDPETDEWILHVRSISRLLRLLHYHYDDNGLFVMDRGSQTEDLAEQTLELVWCALDHCPGPALDWNPQATTADCQSMIYTLMGFVSRKRPIPQWDRAIEYYEKAIALGGSNACVAQSYLAQLYWTRGDTQVARNQTVVLCQTCSNPLLIRQVEQEYIRQDYEDDVWPEMECSQSSSEGSLHHVGSWVVILWLVCLLRKM